MIRLDQSLSSSIPAEGPLDPTYIVVARNPTSADKFRGPLGPMTIKVLKQHEPKGVTPSYFFMNFVPEVYPSKKKISIAITRERIPELTQEIQAIAGPNTKRILAIGTDPSRALCPGFKSLRADHGTVFFNPELNLEVIPTFMFSTVYRQPENRDFITSDLERFYSDDFEEDAPYKICTSVSELPRRNDLVVLDIETTGLDIYDDDIIQIGVKNYGHDPGYIFQPPFDWPGLFDWMKGSTLIGHNLTFDLARLQHKSGKPFTLAPVRDTMLLAKVLGEEVLSLKHLTSLRTTRKGPHGSGGWEDPEYLAEDLYSTEAVYDWYWPKAGKTFMANLLNELVPYVAEMRLFGVALHGPRIQQIVEEFQGKRDRLLLLLEGYSPDTLWTSSAQASEAFLMAGVPLTTLTPTGKYSIAKGALEGIEHPLVQLYQEWVNLDDTLGWIASYLENARSGFLHPKLNLAGTRTGRLSVTDPNLQGVKRVGPIKTIFVSRYERGYIGLIDLDQAELRVVAIISDDDVLAEALLADDVHRQIASKIFRVPYDDVTPIQRKKSKGVTFGLLYGGGARGLSERVGVPIQEVEQITRDFYGQFRKLKKYMDAMKTMAITTGQVSTPFGRLRDLRALIELEGNNSAERKAVNTPVQGTASDIMLVILAEAFKQCRALKLKSFPIFGVHDSGLLDNHPDEVEVMQGIIQQGFERISKTPIADYPLYPYLPLTGEYILGPSWAHVESTNEYYDPSFKFKCTSLPAKEIA